MKATPEPTVVANAEEPQTEVMQKAPSPDDGVGSGPVGAGCSASVPDAYQSEWWRRGAWS